MRRVGSGASEREPPLDDAATPCASCRSATGGVAEGLLILLALALPFEAPLFRLGPLEITTVELALYAMLSAWGIGVAIDVLRDRDGARWRAALAMLPRDEMARAAALWAAILFVSAALAPSDRVAALKFALRSLSGVLAFFATRSLARSRGVARSVLLAIVVGALLSAASALVDGAWPGSAPVWKLFREGTFDVLGLRRPSGVFGYPTIGAMYWEAAVAILIVAPRAWRGWAAAESRRAILVVSASALLFLAILASATRTALAGAAVACVLLAILGRRSGPFVPRIAALALGLLALLSVVALRPGGSDSPLGQRLRWWHDDQWFGVQYDVPAAARTVGAGEVFEVPITLRNSGAIAWRRAGTLATYLSYHWLLPSAKGDAPQLIEFDGYRTALPDDVPPGGVVHVIGVARAPPARGAYRLSWDLLQENVSWFSERGNALGEQAVDVRTASDLRPTPMPYPTAAAAPPSRVRLWRAAVVLWRERPLLGVGPDNFRRRYEAVLSPSPSGAPYTDTRIHANSLYFETLADLGLVGVAGLATLAFALVRSLHRQWDAGRVAGLGCAVAAVAFFVHGLLDYFFEFTPLYGLFWVTLGLTAALPPRPAASSMRPDNMP